MHIKLRNASTQQWRRGWDSNPRGDSNPCYRCGNVGHLKSECRTKLENCRPTANSRPKQNYRGRFKHRGRGAYYVDMSKPEADTEPDHDRDYDTEHEFMASIYSVVEEEENDSPIIVDVTMNGQQIAMELDTGAPVSLMNYDDYKKYFEHLPLLEATRGFHGYSGTPLNVAGKILVDVEYRGQTASLPIFVTRAGRYTPTLLGREWLRKIRLDWPEILSQGLYHIKDADKCATLREQYADLFKDEVGTVKGMEATLHLMEGATPKFLRARTVPYAIRPAVEKELERLEQAGIIEPVQFSRWATPLVCVPKVDGSVRICGDYRSTVNTQLRVEHYPIPSAEEIRQNLAGGQKFSKIDLKCAYQQMKLDEASQELCTISTLKGLYRYTRLPFGIASSPAIWQQFMEQALSGLTGLTVMQDDVLVTGANDDEHLKNLEQLFARFRKYGLRIKAEKCSFMKPTVVYYGLCISKEGVKPTKDKVESIKQAPVPKNQTELRSFLGMIAALSSFIANLPTLTHPLNKLLGNEPWQWTEQCDMAFTQLKEAITSLRMLF